MSAAGNRYVMFSAGGGSFRAALLWRREYPDANLRLVFTDTLYEDADAYRFLIEASAHVFGRRLDWTISVEDFPDYRVPEDVPIEQYRGNPEWRAFLADLRARAAKAIPELVWLVEGRDPWEVYRDERFIGNNRADPCSKILKRRSLDRWRRANCSPAVDTFAIGIGDHERHRFDDGEGGGLRPRMAESGWRYEAPLIAAVDGYNDSERRLRGELHIAASPLEEIGGPAPPRLYALGYIHNNCGGFCCKAGQAHWQNRFNVHPERFAYDAMMERKLMAHIGVGAWPMLTDRRGDGRKKPLSLDAFAARLRANPQMKLDYLPGESGCGCMLDDAA